MIFISVHFNFVQVYDHVGGCLLLAEQESAFSKEGPQFASHINMNEQQRGRSLRHRFRDTSTAFDFFAIHQRGHSLLDDLTCS